MEKTEIVASYKELIQVEMAFRNLKTVQLEMRPVYHKTDNRIRAHVFLCVLAYYLQWHINRSLQPLFESDGKYKDRAWTFRAVIDRLSAIRQQRVKINKVEFNQITIPDKDQKFILDLLKIKM